MIVVHPIDRPFKVNIQVGEGKTKTKVVLTFRQLTYNQNSAIMTECYLLNKAGIGTIDQAKKAYICLQQALIDIEGFTGEDGKPYKLKTKLENGLDILEEECLDQLLATPISDKILFTAAYLGQQIPKTIFDPLSGKKLEGVEVIQPSKSAPKKK